MLRTVKGGSTETEKTHTNTLWCRVHKHLLLVKLCLNHNSIVYHSDITKNEKTNYPKMIRALSSINCNSHVYLFICPLINQGSHSGTKISFWCKPIRQHNIYYKHQSAKNKNKHQKIQMGKKKTFAAALWNNRRNHTEYIIVT